MEFTEPRTRGSILIVDDQKNWRDTIGELLRNEGYQVHTVASLLEAQECLSTNVFEVVVLDIRLVDEDRHDVQGLGVLEEIRKKDDKTCVLVLTGYPTAKTEAKATEIGVEAFFFKSPPEGLDIVQFREVVSGLVKQSHAARLGREFP